MGTYECCDANNCVADAFKNEAICLGSVGAAYTLAVESCPIACAFSGPAYFTCLVLCESAATAAAAIGVTYCHVVLIAELEKCRELQAQCK